MKGRGSKIATGFGTFHLDPKQNHHETRQHTPYHPENEGKRQEGYSGNFINTLSGMRDTGVSLQS